MKTNHVEARRNIEKTRQHLTEKYVVPATTPDGEIVFSNGQKEKLLVEVTEALHLFWATK